MNLPAGYSSYDFMQPTCMEVTSMFKQSKLLLIITHNETTQTKTDIKHYHYSWRLLMIVRV